MIERRRRRRRICSSSIRRTTFGKQMIDGEIDVQFSHEKTKVNGRITDEEGMNYLEKS